MGRAGQDDNADGDTSITHQEITDVQLQYGEETTFGAVDNSSRFTDATRQLGQYRAGRVLFRRGRRAHPPATGPVRG